MGHEQNGTLAHPSLALKNISQALFVLFLSLLGYWNDTESLAFLNGRRGTEVPKSPLPLSSTLFSPPKACLGPLSA